MRIDMENTTYFILDIIHRTMKKHQQVWLFGPIGVLLGITVFSLTGNVSAALYTSFFIGLPTWFIGGLVFGMKADEWLGVEGAFAYNDLSDTRSDTNNG